MTVTLSWILVTTRLNIVNKIWKVRFLKYIDTPRAFLHLTHIVTCLSVIRGYVWALEHSCTNATLGNWYNFDHSCTNPIRGQCCEMFYNSDISYHCCATVSSNKGSKVSALLLNNESRSPFEKDVGQTEVKCPIRCSWLKLQRHESLNTKHTVKYCETSNWA